MDERPNLAYQLAWEISFITGESAEDIYNMAIAEAKARPVTALEILQEKRVRAMRGTSLYLNKLHKHYLEEDHPNEPT